MIRDSGGHAQDIIRPMFVVYEVLLYLVFVLALPFFLITGLIRGKYLTNFPERMGLYRTPVRRHDIWIHAVLSRCARMCG